MGQAEVDGGSLFDPFGLDTLGPQEGQGLVDAVDLSQPSFEFGLLAPQDQVCLQLFEPGQHGAHQ
ncbi:hypothetical protein ACFRAI_21275 [Streptomyces sp. NPDC056637]|uniref:hypothetical protein n=1 Tax=unclassified Streptomyces TaxID=2593676 RepID=UPI003631DA35